MVMDCSDFFLWVIFSEIPGGCESVETYSGASYPGKWWIRSHSGQQLKPHSVFVEDDWPSSFFVGAAPRVYSVVVAVTKGTKQRLVKRDLIIIIIIVIVQGCETITKLRVLPMVFRWRCRWQGTFSLRCSGWFVLMIVILTIFGVKSHSHIQTWGTISALDCESVSSPEYAYSSR